MTIALIAGTGGALVTSITQALAAHPAAAGRQAAPIGLAAARSATVAHWATAAGQPDAGHAAGRAAIKMSASQPAPLVTDGTGPGKSKLGRAVPRMSRAMLRASRLKQAAANAYLRQARPPAAKFLAATQQAQIRNYYCGPATVSEMLAQLGVVLSQPAAARELGTDAEGGTDWSNSRGYPVPRVLDASQHRARYVAVGLPWTPTRAQVSTYISDLVTDISRGAGVPIAGNAYEVPGGPHLLGHPPGQEIMHWFDIRGYSDAGAVTAYEDSVHGASSIAWSGSVPAYSALPSATIVDILGARGYVW